MAMRLQHAEEGATEISEINVTPFIDVMLVLLVIFMVTAPLATVNVPVNLPSSNSAEKPPEKKPVFLTLQADLSIAVGDNHVSRDQLAASIADSTNGDRSTQIFLRADKTIAYEHVMDLLNALREAGYLKVALVGLGSGSSS